MIMNTMLRNLLLVLLVGAAVGQYAVVGREEGSTFVKLQLKYTGTREYYVKPQSKVAKELVFLFKALTYSEFTFSVYDPAVPRFQVPQGGVFPTDQQANFSFPLSIAAYKINFTLNHFSFLVTRKANDAVIFDSSVVELEFSDYYVQFGTILDSKTLFGYSERFAEHFKLRPGTWTVFSRDDGQMVDGGAVGQGKQTGGYYPAYMVRERSGLHHMGYYRTSQALDVEVESFSNTSYLKIYRAIGGIIDFRFILGESSPELLITNFHQLLGKSLIPPFWSLGFHQCRWGYKNITSLETVLAKYQQNDLPLDTIWTDIDYMHEFETFTVDTDDFPLDRLRAILKDHQYIPIVEPSVRNRVGYAYNEGKKRNVFIKSAEGDDLIGKVWAGEVLFTDFFHPNATEYWEDMMQYLYNQVPFSGVWLDMNEISNMCDGPCTPPTKPGVFDYSKDLPYTPGGGNIELRTIPLNSTHFGNYLQADVHPFFGLMHTYNTYEFLRKKTMPFIITRSTTLGSNRFGFHWTGDNYANFTFLRLSITSNFMFGLWGVQMVGSDICGFGGNATEEVCSRYFQLGSLYPFARDHNEFDMVDQEPYALGPVVLECARKNLKQRYSLLKSYYREFIIRKGVGTIFRPLFYEFLNDENLLQDDTLETQFLIGRSIMAAPVVEEGKKQRTVYFPEDIWYNMQTGEPHQPKSLGIVENGLTDLVPLYLRNGHTIFRQSVENVTKSRELSNYFELVGGFRQLSSNTTHFVYTSQGGLLSLGDYNDAEDVHSCLTEDCEYTLVLTLSINKGSKLKTLEIATSFQGKSVRNEQFLTALTLFTENDVFKLTPPAHVSVYAVGRTTLEFP